MGFFKDMKECDVFEQRYILYGFFVMYFALLGLAIFGLLVELGII